MCVSSIARNAPNEGGQICESRFVNGQLKNNLGTGGMGTSKEINRIQQNEIDRPNDFSLEYAEAKKSRTAHANREFAPGIK